MCKWGTLVDVKLFRPRPVSGRLVVPVDKCIAPIVQLLNDSGVRTLGSCCGHGKAPGFVSFEDLQGIAREIPLQVATIDRSEADLSAPVCDWLHGRGFQVFAEVPIDHWTPDLVARRMEEDGSEYYVVVELKGGLTSTVGRQASRSIPFAHEVWVAVGTQPAKRGRGWRLCELHGMGVISCKSGQARTVKNAELIKPYRKINFRNMEPGGVGGLPNSSRTPAQDVKKAIIAYVAEHPNATWKEIYRGVPNHYAHAKSLAQHHKSSRLAGRAASKREKAT